MTVATLYTIGVYGFDERSFVGELKLHAVDALVDVRQRRGVRGTRYAFANATRLDSLMLDAGIAVVVRKDLAPSSSLRSVQKESDRAAGGLKSTRRSLAPEFVAGYRAQILDRLDPGEILADLDAYERPAFLCVERGASACHRSILAEWLASASNLSVVNLGP